MLKKVLYAVASFILGFLLIMTVITVNSYSVFMSKITEAVGEKNYLEVAKFSSAIFDYDSKIDSGESLGDGLYVEIYESLFLGTRTISESVSHNSLELGIQVLVYNFPEDFKLEDTETEKGGISIVFENDEEAFFPFVSENSDYYTYATNYSFVPFGITYEDYLAEVEKNDDLTAETAIKAIKISDSADKEYVVATTGLSFVGEVFEKFRDIAVEYNTLQKDYAEGKEASEEVQNAFNSKYEKALENKGSLVMGHNDTVIYSSSEFLVPVIIAAVVFLALDILVAWLIFRKKKPSKYIPPYQQKVQVNHEPEQFNRDVFNVEDYDVEETTEEEKVEEVKIEE